jgi:hypothetical protein
LSDVRWRVTKISFGVALLRLRYNHQICHLCITIERKTKTGKFSVAHSEESSSLESERYIIYFIEFTEFWVTKSMSFSKILHITKNFVNLISRYFSPVRLFLFWWNQVVWWLSESLQSWKVKEYIPKKRGKYALNIATFFISDICSVRPHKVNI